MGLIQLGQKLSQVLIKWNNDIQINIINDFEMDKKTGNILFW